MKQICTVRLKSKDYTFEDIETAREFLTFLKEKHDKEEERRIVPYLNEPEMVFTAQGKRSARLLSKIRKQIEEKNEVMIPYSTFGTTESKKNEIRKRVKTTEKVRKASALKTVNALIRHFKNNDAKTFINLLRKHNILYIALNGNLTLGSYNNNYSKKFKKPFSYSQKDIKGDRIYKLSTCYETVGEALL